MKKQVFIAVATLFTLGGFAQTLQEIIKKTENENFESAAKDFKALIAKDATKGEYYFYYGENFFKRGESYIDSANIFYNKGVEVNATNPLNYIGLGKVLLTKNNVNDAKSQFYKAATLGANKNAEVLRKIAEAWLVTDNKNTDEAINMANAAIKLDPKNPMGYILLGDAQLEKNPTDGNEPIKNYKKASTLDPKSTVGILREGKLYQRGRNYQLALDKYKEAEAIDPNFAPAYREKAELFFLSNQSGKSIENWKKYLELNNSDFARYRFMSALFRNKQYAEAVVEYENLKKQNYTKLYMERLAGYSYEEMGDKLDKDAFNKGLNAINKFFEMAGSDFKYLSMDYKYRGFLMMRSGKDSTGGLMEIEKAIAMDAAIAPECYGKIAKLYQDSKNWEKAIKYYEKKRNGDYKNLSVSESFDLGKAYYNSGNKKRALINTQKEQLLKSKKPVETPEIKAKEAEAATYFLKADSALKNLTQLNPGYIMGHVWRARVNSVIDQKIESDSTKTYYEKAISLMKPEEKTSTYKNSLIEALEYLGYYYVTRKDKSNADAVFNQIKELDPANEKQKNYFAPPKQAAPKTGAPKPGGK